jgi:hypothetical protein
LPTACDAGEDEVSAAWRENFGPPLGSKNGLIHGRRSRAAVALRKERTAALKAARAEVAAAIAQAEAVLRAARQGRAPGGSCEGEGRVIDGEAFSQRTQKD